MLHFPTQCNNTIHVHVKGIRDFSEADAEAQIGNDQVFQESSQESKEIKQERLPDDKGPLCS